MKELIAYMLYKVVAFLAVLVAILYVASLVAMAILTGLYLAGDYNIKPEPFVWLFVITISLEVVFGYVLNPVTKMFTTKKK